MTSVNLIHIICIGNILLYGEEMQLNCMNNLRPNLWDGKEKTCG
jgi:hypothetical protein